MTRRITLAGLNPCRRIQSDDSNGLQTERGLRLPASLIVLLLILVACGGGGTAVTPTVLPVVPQTLDINGLAIDNGFLRVSGSASTGRFGVPVAGGWDCCVATVSIQLLLTSPTC